jgi:acetyl esterase/lipase
VISSPLTRRKLAGHLATAASARVLVPAYRLAPEHPFPAAVDDAAAAYRWLLRQGIASARVVVAGDSSGGGLTVATLLALRDARDALPAGAVPISPWVDLACSGESLVQNAQADLTVTKASLQRMAGQYLHGADPRTPLASPLYADLAGLPPLFIVVGGAEALLDDAVRLARTAGLAGVDATLTIVAGMQHIFPIYFGYLPEADAAVHTIGEWIRQRTMLPASG